MGNTKLFGRIVKSAAVFLGGVTLYYLLNAILFYVFYPGASGIQLALYSSHRKQYPHSPVLDQQIRNFQIFVRFVLPPLVGGGVGCFVGLFQKSKTALIATICLLPDMCMQWLPILIAGPYPAPAEMAKALISNALEITSSIVAAIAIARITERLKASWSKMKKSGSLPESAQA
jgi:hypothetical protein